MPGHWEGDLIMGKGKTAIGTLVERQSRFVMLFKAPHGNTAEGVRVGTRATIEQLPQQLVQTVTWDQAKRRPNMPSSRIDTGIQMYFCDPRSPWQRGSNGAPTDSSANISSKAPTYPWSPNNNSTTPPTASTPDLDKPSTG